MRRRPKPRVQPGHYRPPQVNLPGRYNAPRRGRIGKQMPPLKKLNKRKRG